MGFIGLHTARRFLDEGQDVVITVFRTRREPDFIKDELGKRVKVEAVDITAHHDVIEAVRKHNVNHIVHLAVPGLAALTPAEDYRTNMVGWINILEAGRLAGVQRVTLASSVAVYAGLPRGPFKEDALLPIPSTNPTETWKKAMEITGLHYGSNAGMEVVSARLSGIFGPLYHTLASFVSRIAHAAAKNQEPSFANARGGVPFEEDSGDLCYVKDCAAGLVQLQLAPSLPKRIYNIGGGVAVKNREVIEAAQKVNPNLRVSIQPGAGSRNKPDGYFDLTQSAADFGYKPEYPIERAVADYIGWLKSNPL